MKARSTVTDNNFPGTPTAAAPSTPLPVDIVKIRLQMQTLLHVAERQEVMEIAWGLSVRILYQGAQFCFLRDVPYTLLFFPSYATLRDARADQPTGKTSMLPIVWAGATTGAGGAVIGTHADVVKSGLEAKGSIHGKNGLPPEGGGGQLQRFGTPCQCVQHR
ncbi:putative calcium-binding mitochondrial carrier protein Aralar1 [Phytophthora infestans]|uniref:Putative calcium-binding mitochondrial carrier protein Aralar1 n=1 Tax=Phytophthora infestans TaxID=4787 RepID=A0A8S9U7G1_PHYIN|nr:putative calcium-binding mitochondrial carrier protein Aralar1 [Phytophthora infestans]